MGVEKLFPAKFAKIKSRQEALQTTFSVFLDIFYPPNFGYFEENGLFQQPQLLTPIEIVFVPSVHGHEPFAGSCHRVSLAERALLLLV